MIIKGRGGGALEGFYHAKTGLIEITVIDSEDGECSTAFFSLGKSRAVLRMLTKIITKMATINKEE